jgi:hypothetical protein
MEILNGKLEFISLWHPIKLTDNKDDIDLREYCWKVFNTLNGCPAILNIGMNEIEICEDLKSSRHLEFKMNDDGILILLTEKIGFTNIVAYLSDILQRLNGMHIIVTINEKGIKFEHDIEENVFKLNYTHSNSCKLTDNDINQICKIGETDCCIFLSITTDGFMCEKFGSLSSVLLNKYATGNMRANRIGNCQIIGRIEQD